MEPTSLPEIPELEDGRLRELHTAAAELVRRTPLLTSASVSERCGGTVSFKAECLQRTGSFKLRGALAKLQALAAGTEGVVAASAGNHGQSLAYAARHRGLRCEVYMPANAAISKLTAVRAFGATVDQEGASVDECVELARQRARDAGFQFVHPFDDYDVIAGQAGVGLELAEEVPDLRKVILPVGGGGLAAGVAVAIKRLRPEVEIVGVQAARCAPVVAALGAGGGETGRASAETIADGIAVKQPGELTLPLLERLLDGMVTVEEETIAEAMTLLLERSKLVVEGAGAVALAALLCEAATPAAAGSTVAVLSGGNVDVGRLASIAAHEETRAGRRVRFFTLVTDRPGGLAALLGDVAKTGANLISVEHVRDGVPLAVGETGVVLTVETRGSRHRERLFASLREAGYPLPSDLR